MNNVWIFLMLFAYFTPFVLVLMGIFGDVIKSYRDEDRP